MTSTADRWQVASRANVPPFHVMDLLAAAAQRQRTPRRPAQPAGRPAEQRRAGAGAGRGDPAAAGRRPAGLHAGRRDPRAARGDRRPPQADATASTSTPTRSSSPPGSSGGFLLAFLAAFEVGDKVAMARPGYPCYRNVLTALGIEVVEIPTGPETRFQPTVEQVAELHEQHDLKGLVVASPANPTGTMLLPSELAALAQWCEAEQVQLISDEIYHGIEYAPLTAEQLARSAWETSREAVVFASFSKYFSMTGWRIGWMLVPDRLRRAVRRAHRQLHDLPAGDRAARLPRGVQRRGVRRARRPRAAVRRQPAAAARRAAPARASPSSRRPTARSTSTPTSATSADDTMAFCHDLLARTGVAMAPGIDFDTEAGHRFVRLSFAGPGSRHRGGAGPALHSPLTRRFPSTAGGPGRPTGGRHVRRHRGDPRAGPHHARPGRDAARRGAPAAGPRRGGAVGRGWRPTRCAARVRAQVAALRRTAALARRRGRGPGRGTPTRWTGSRR